MEIDYKQAKVILRGMTCLNDYIIIKGVNGEFYPCKPDIFAKTYEKVTE